ncbi:MAG TPA: NRDE family protein [Candidatus Saccharimonadaceae bacterium]|jgi:uncharacterized protein with NRDE domain|nr:NRDE family protein [Candidatus Saccharimonadaceae bacterium]
MCTLILGRDVPGRRRVVLAANRDENPARPSDPPGPLRDAPPLAGGRDRLSGGTWLAVRERRAVVAMLNRRPAATESGPWRSRGLLALDVAALDEPDRDAALALARRHAYAPFSLVFASPDACWLVARDAGGEPFARDIGPGWHVLTHTDLDDAREPRAAWLLAALAAHPPGTADDAERALRSRLAEHGAPGKSPAVCLHEGRMVTVSSSLVWLGPGEARYLHADGRPCTTPFVDQTSLLRGEAQP